MYTYTKYTIVHKFIEVIYVSCLYMHGVKPGQVR